MFPGEEAAKPGAGLPNTGWARVGAGEEKTDAGAEVNEKGELDGGAVDELKTTGAEFIGLEDVADAPKENPVAGDEPKIEDVGAGKLEPKALEGAVLELTELIAEDEAEELPPNLNTPEAPLLKELAALDNEAEAGELNPKLKTGAAPPVDPPALVEEEELPKKLVVTGAEPEEFAPKLTPEAEVPPVDPTALIEEEEELKPKLNKLGVVKLLEPPALPSKTEEGIALNKLDVGPLLETTAPPSDEEAEELRPKDMVGLKP